MATAGSIQEVAVNGTGFAVAADNEATIFGGGFTNETKMNGDGTERIVKTRMPWKVSGLELAIDFSRGDLALIQSLAGGESFAVVVTLADDTEMKGTGQIEGEYTASSQNSTVSMDLAGGGVLTS